MAWGKRWQARDPQCQTLFHRFERKWKNRPRIFKRRRRGKKKAEGTPTQSHLETGLNKGLRLKMSNQRRRTPCPLVSGPLLKPTGPAGRRKGPSWGLPEAEIPQPHPIKTLQDPPELPGLGLGPPGVQGPSSFLRRPPRVGTEEENPTKGKKGGGGDPTTDSPGEESRAQERASQSPDTKSQTLNQ